MDRSGVGKACLALPGATMDHPFGPGHDAYKVGGKMFAIVGAEGGLSFKVSDIAYEVLTEEGRAAPAPYLARAKWVHLADPGDWPDDELADHLKSAHALIAAKLTKKAKPSVAPVPRLIRVTCSVRNSLAPPGRNGSSIVKCRPIAAGSLTSP